MMAAARSSPSPSPPPAVPTTDQTGVTSHRYAALRKVYTGALRATLVANSYPNFASCFPTPATYCPRALEGVWRQLNTRLEEECIKDFDKICQERHVGRGLAAWEQLVEDAKARKAEQLEAKDTDVVMADSLTGVVKPMHLLTAGELHVAHLTPTLIKVEQELLTKLKNVQQNNLEMMDKIEQQRAEMQQLMGQLEKMAEDVEGAANAIENDEMREDLRQGIFTTMSTGIAQGKEG